MSSLPDAIVGNINVLNSCLELLSLLDENQYANALESNSSIGAHLRHSLDHYLCFFSGVSGKLVNYDVRPRNENVENEKATAAKTVKSVINKLESFDTGWLSQQMTIITCANIHADDSEFASTVERELAFLSSHTIHHLAIMNLLAQFQGIKTNSNSAKAFSTEKFEANKK